MSATKRAADWTARHEKTKSQGRIQAYMQAMKNLKIQHVHAKKGQPSFLRLLIAEAKKERKKLLKVKVL